MMHLERLSPKRVLPGLCATALGFLPSLAAAHPGHYHPPGEDDEFDAITGALHALPDWQSILLAAAALGVIALVTRGNKHNDTPAL